jgi:hypothetical protein
MGIVVDKKPTGVGVFTNKPSNLGIKTSTPRISRVYREDVVYDPMYLYGGVPMGLLLTLTYPKTIEISGR